MTHSIFVPYVISALFILLITVIMLFLKKNTVKYLFILMLIFLTTAFYLIKLDFLVPLIGGIFSFLGLLLLASLKRKNLYGLFFGLFGLSVIIYIFASEALADFLASTAYFILVLGVLLDIFYDKIYSN